MSSNETILENYDKYKNLRIRAEQKLANPKFLEKAKPELVEKEKIVFKNLKENEEHYVTIIKNAIKIHFRDDNERIFWHIQYSREKRITAEEYSPEWFDIYLKPEISEEDYLNLFKDGKEFISTHISYNLR